MILKTQLHNILLLRSNGIPAKVLIHKYTHIYSFTHSLTHLHAHTYIWTQSYTCKHTWGLIPIPVFRSRLFVACKNGGVYAITWLHIAQQTGCILEFGPIISSEACPISLGYLFNRNARLESVTSQIIWRNVPGSSLPLVHTASDQNWKW